MYEMTVFEHSSTLDFASFDDSTSTIRIGFKNGAQYEYWGRSMMDPPDDLKMLYADLKASESPGKFFQSFIRPLNYRKLATKREEEK
jgi:hypothetical protein